MQPSRRSSTTTLRVPRQNASSMGLRSTPSAESTWLTGAGIIGGYYRRHAPGHPKPHAACDSAWSGGKRSRAALAIGSGALLREKVDQWLFRQSWLWRTLSRIANNPVGRRILAALETRALARLLAHTKE